MRGEVNVTTDNTRGETCGQLYPHVWYSSAEPREAQRCVCGEMIWHRGGIMPTATPPLAPLSGYCWCGAYWDDHGLPGVDCLLRLQL